MVKISDEMRNRFEREALPHLSTLHRAARRYAASEADAEDLVQETLLKALGAWDRLREDSNVRGWLLTILRNTYINLWRRPRRRATHLQLDAMEPLHSYDSADRIPEKSFFAGWVDPHVREAIEELPDEYRKTFLLQALEGHACESIAELLSVPVGTVKSRVHRARRQLRRRLLDRTADPAPANNPRPATAVVHSARGNGG